MGSWWAFLTGKREAEAPMLHTERLELRLPVNADFGQWVRLRRASRDFLQPWEPQWPRDHLSQRSFRRRVRWSRVEAEGGRSLSYLIFTRHPRRLVGGITLSNIRRGPSQCGTLGYWIGEEYARHGYMTEATEAVARHAFADEGLTRLEAACLEENTASRKLLAACGFRFEGVARSYLEVNGSVRDHMLFARVEGDESGGA